MTRAFALILAGLTIASTARAEHTCVAISRPSPKLLTIDPETRLTFIRAELRDQAARARLWSASWGLFGVGVAGESIAFAAASSTAHERIVWLAQGLPALGFPGLMLLDPLDVMADSRDLETEITGASSSNRDRCALLARAEALFQNDAADERRKTGIVAHALGVLANIASSAVIVLGTGDWGAALVNGAGGIAVSEINLWTLPTGAVSALDRYRAGELFAPAINASTVHARGLGLTITW